MMVNFAILRWLVVFVASIITAAFIQHKGLFAALWVADMSGISFVILSIYLVLTVYMGVLTRRLTLNDPSSDIFKNNIPYLHGCWYASELLMALGMMGTLIGFTLMLGPALAGLDATNLAISTAAIFKMAAGMGTAVLTTLVGLIASQLVKIQIINIETTIYGYESDE
jgi:hypothetical protein